MSGESAGGRGQRRGGRGAGGERVGVIVSAPAAEASVEAEGCAAKAEPVARGPWGDHGVLQAAEVEAARNHPDADALHQSALSLGDAGGGDASCGFERHSCGLRGRGGAAAEPSV